MKRSFSVVLIGLIALGVSACTQDATPSDAINSAFVSAAKNDQKEFRSLLTGSALSQYGTEEGFEAFRRALTGLDPEARTATLVSDLDNRKTYSLLVNSSDDPATTILTAQISCTESTDLKTQVCKIESIYFN